MLLSPIFLRVEGLALPGREVEPIVCGSGFRWRVFHKDENEENRQRVKEAFKNKQFNLLLREVEREQPCDNKYTQLKTTK